MPNKLTRSKRPLFTDLEDDEKPLTVEKREVKVNIL